MYKTILLPTDGTEFCERAIRHGVALAQICKAKVIGITITAPLHTVTPGFMIPAALKGVMKAETEKMCAERLALVESVAKSAGVAVETMHKANDNPWQAIIQAATDHGCDLIVMASHGRRGIVGAVLGSETQKVLIHSKVPVLVVR